MKNLKTCFAVLLGVLAFLSLAGYDWFFTTEDPFRNGEARYLMLAMTLCLGVQLWRCNPAWALFWSWSCILWVCTGWATYGMMDVLMIFGCLFVGDAVRSTFRKHGVVNVIALLAVAESFYSWIQLLGLDPFFSWTSARWQNEAIGTLGHFTLIGPFIGLGAVYYFSRGFKGRQGRRSFLGFLICGTTVLLSHSTMSLLGLIAGLGYVVWRRERAVAYWFGGLGISALCVWKYLRPGAEFFGFSGREIVWPYVWRQWMEAPILGHGPGYWAGVLPITNIQGVGSDHWYQAHFDLLQVGPEQGAVGILIVLAGLALGMRKAQKMPEVYGAWIALLFTNSLANLTFHVPCFGLLAGWLASAVHNHEVPEAPWQNRRQ